MMPVIVYCRGCNREVTVLQEFGDSYVERLKGKVHYHPKVDCDIINYFNPKYDTIKPEIQRRDTQ